MEEINTFLEARQYIVDSIETTLEVYLCNKWDPLCKFHIFKELHKIFDEDFERLFPSLDPYYRPNFKYRIFGEEEGIEVNIQNYINDSRGFDYLGSCSMGIQYDLYYRNPFIFDDPTLIARYGHEKNSYFSGAKTAKSEYLLGEATPLSIAYGMALYDGFIE